MSDPAPRLRWRMILGRELGLAIAFVLLTFPWFDLTGTGVERLRLTWAEVVDLIAGEQQALGGSRSASIDWKISADRRVWLLGFASVAGASLALLLAPRKRTPRLACAAAVQGAAGIASIILRELVNEPHRWPRPRPDATTVLAESAPFLLALVPLAGLFFRWRWARVGLLIFVPALVLPIVFALIAREFTTWGPSAVSALLALALVVEGTTPGLLQPPTTDPSEP